MSSPSPPYLLSYTPSPIELPKFPSTIITTTIFNIFSSFHLSNFSSKQTIRPISNSPLKN